MRKDITDEIELKDERSNPFGYSCSGIWHKNKHIGFFVCGKVSNLEIGYSHKTTKDKFFPQFPCIKIYKGEK